MASSSIESPPVQVFEPESVALVGRVGGLSASSRQGVTATTDGHRLLFFDDFQQSGAPLSHFGPVARVPLTGLTS
jgi:hypothetical protein